MGIALDCLVEISRRHAKKRSQIEHHRFTAQGEDAWNKDRGVFRVHDFSVRVTPQE